MPDLTVALTRSFAVLLMARLPLGAAVAGYWSFAFGARCSRSSWVTRVVPQRAESALSLQVTAFQLAITLGASVGGAIAAQQPRLSASLGVRLGYDHVLKRVRATAGTACSPGRVRRGSCPHGTHICEIWLT